MRMSLKRDLHAVVHEFDGQRSECFRKLHDVRDIPRCVVVDEHLLCGTGGQNGRVIGRREVCGLADDKFGRLFLGDFRKIDVGMLSVAREQHGFALGFHEKSMGIRAMLRGNGGDF